MTGSTFATRFYQPGEASIQLEACGQAISCTTEIRHFDIIGAAPTPTPGLEPLPALTPTSEPDILPTGKPAPAPTPTQTPLPTATHTPATTGKTSDCVSNPSPQFTAYVTDLAMIDYIILPMVISGKRVKSRSYIGNSRDQNNQIYELPIFAPVDSRLISIGYFFYFALNSQGELVEVYEYDIEFEVICEIYYKFGHVTRLAGNPLAVAPTVPRGYLTLDLPPSVKAGDLIAHTTGTIQAHNRDFVFNNLLKSNQFTNQEHYERDLQHLLTSDCPYDYYSEELKNEYYSLLTGGFSGTIQGAVCRVFHEQPGTISGGWFTQPFTNPSSPDSVSALAIGVWADPISGWLMTRLMSGSTRENRRT